MLQRRNCLSQKSCSCFREVDNVGLIEPARLTMGDGLVASGALSESLRLKMQLVLQNPLPALHRTTGLEISTGNYRLTTAHYRQITGIYDFHYKGCLSLLAIYRQGWSIYRRLPPLMKNYRHVGNAVMKSCTSSCEVFEYLLRKERNSFKKRALKIS